MEGVPAPRASRWLPLLLAALALVPPPLSGQTIRGRLLDATNGQPIELGILVLLTTDGDTLAMTASHPDGRFSISAPEPGDFLLHASAWGYSERVEGVFELGEGGRMDVEFRVAPRPMELEEILVPIDRPVLDHPLVRNGFVRRYQRGRGHFITPRDLERTVYSDTEALFHFIPGVRVVPSRNDYATGERVLMRNPWGYCTPTVYVDGTRTEYRPGTGETLSLMAHVDWIEAVEVYSRPTQAPLEYGGAAGNHCGVILFWTKR